MNKHIHNFIKGMANLWPAEPRDYIHPTGGGFAQDARAIRGDFTRVSKDMHKALRKHEQTKTH